MARGVGSEIPTVVLFGSRLHRLTLQETCDAAEAMIRAHDRCHLICVKDVGLTIRVRDDPFLRRFYDRADLVVVDGRGLLLAGRLLGQPLLRRAALRGYRVYLLGARREVVEKVATRLRGQTPPVCVAGWHDGYFAGRESEVVKDITKAKPDILIVGISTPIREQFLDAWRDRLPPCVCVPVGGVLDIEAGFVRAAPQWVSRAGLEWLFRVLQEPRRLALRYGRTHSRFALALAGEFARRRLRRGGGS